MTSFCFISSLPLSLSPFLLPSLRPLPPSLSLFLPLLFPLLSLSLPLPSSYSFFISPFPLHHRSSIPPLSLPPLSTVACCTQQTTMCVGSTLTATTSGAPFSVPLPERLTTPSNRSNRDQHQLVIPWKLYTTAHWVTFDPHCAAATTSSKDQPTERLKDEKSSSLASAPASKPARKVGYVEYREYMHS